jgi:hypothetical protein
MNLWGSGFSYTKSRFSPNGGCAKLHQNTFFTYFLTLLYDFLILVVLK